MKGKFYRQILKNIQMSNFTEILSVEAEAFHAHGQPDMRKLRVTYRNFAKVHKNY